MKAKLRFLVAFRFLVALSMLIREFKTLNANSCLSYLCLVRLTSNWLVPSPIRRTILIPNWRTL